jgi:hypothetical protein
MDEDLGLWNNGLILLFFPFTLSLVPSGNEIASIFVIQILGM